MTWRDAALHIRKPCPRPGCKGTINDYRDDLGPRCSLCQRSPVAPAPLPYVSNEAKPGGNGVSFPEGKAG